MTPASSKAKGRRLQNEVRDLIKEKYGFEPDTAVMGEKGKDVKDDRLPYSIECKNVEKLNLWAAWKQAKDNLFEGDTPVVIFTKNSPPGKPKEDRLAVVPLDWFLDRLEVREHGSVQPKGSRGEARTGGNFSSEGNGPGPDLADGGHPDAGCCLACRCLEAAGWVRPSPRKD